MRAKPVQKIYSGAEPKFFRIYKTEQLLDVVKSVPLKYRPSERLSPQNVRARTKEVV
jgi:hypothetical protein